MNDNDPLDDLIRRATPDYERLEQAADLGLETRIRSRLGDTDRGFLPWQRPLRHGLIAAAALTGGIALQFLVVTGIQAFREPQLTAWMFERIILGI